MDNLRGLLGIWRMDKVLNEWSKAVKDLIKWKRETHGRLL